MFIVSQAKNFLSKRLHGLARKCAYSKDYGHAVLAYKILLRVAPGDSAAYTSLVDLLYFLGDFHGAMRQIDDWLCRHPDDHMSHVRAAYYHTEHREWDNAELHLRSLLDFDTPSSAALTCLANLQMFRLELDKARASIDSALEVFPSSYEARLVKAQILSSQNDKASAISILEEAVQANPEKIDAYAILARMGNFSDYSHPHIQTMKSAIQDSSRPPMERMMLSFAMGDTCDALRRWDEAFSWFAMGNALDPREFDETTIADRVNTNIATFTKDMIQGLLSRAGSRSGDQLIFIFGMPRSGSTLLEQILASHPDVHATGEGPELLHSIATFPEIASSLNNYPYCIDRISDDLLSNASAIHATKTMARSPNSRMFTDKSLDNWLELGLLATLFPKAKLVHCVRDPRDTCLSMFFQVFLGIKFTNDMKTIGKVYNAYRTMMAHWDAVLPTKPYEVAYEDLVRNPEKNIKSLLEYCGLSWSPKCLEFHNTKRVALTASAYQVKQPFYTRSIERWRNYESHIQPLIASLEEQHCV